MKRLITIIALVAVMASSCETDYSDGRIPERTRSGRTLFGFAKVIVSDVAMFVSEMEQLNSYIRSGEAEREAMSNGSWYKYRDIEQDSIDTNQWFINRSSFDGVKVKAVLQGGAPLSEVGAKWSVECELPYLTVKNIACTLERISTSELRVTFTDGWTRNGKYPFEFNEMVFTFNYNSVPVILLSNTLFAYNVSAEGRCTSVGDRNVYMTFVADELAGTTAQRTESYYGVYYPVRFNAGTMSVVMDRNGKSQSVEAKYRTASSVEIKYEGVTETYNDINAIEFYKSNESYYY